MGQIYRANAKINWALDILGRRADGYHMMNMVMQSVALCDELSIEPAPALSLSVDGAPAGEDNLVMRAALALRRHTGTNLGANMALTKRIPAQAGLGGGSADCAAALKALNEMWGLGLDRARLLEIGASLGADVPFCLTGGLARVSGIGEVIAPVQCGPEIPLALVRPGGGLSTAAVFGLWDGGGFPATPFDAGALTDALVRRDSPAVGRLCVNALTAPAVRLLPEIGRALDKLRRLGAFAAFMTGSGSTVVGAFGDDAAAQAAARAFPDAVATCTLGESLGDRFL